MTPFKVRRGSLFLDAGDSIQGQERDFLDMGDFIQGKGEFLSGFWKSGDCSSLGERVLFWILEISGDSIQGKGGSPPLNAWKSFYKPRFPMQKDHIRTSMVL